MFLALGSQPETRQTFLALIRSVAGSPEVANLLRQFMETTVLTRIATALGIPTLRLTAAAAQMMGLAMIRYVLAAEPMASATDDEVVELVAPVLQHYFTE
jgi:hypothetical protein